MTTIAFDGKTLAADKRRTCGNGLIRTGTKIFDCGAFVYGSAGDAADGLLIVEWLKDGRRPNERPEVEDNTAFGIAIRKSDRAIFQVEDKQIVLVPIEDAQYAVGTGREFALAAMAFGKTAREAVEFAMRFDSNTGNGVDVYEFEV